MSCNAVCTNINYSYLLRSDVAYFNSNSIRAYNNVAVSDVVYYTVEREAKDAVSWLKAAGFPQYVQMYAGKLNVSPRAWL